MRPDFRWESYRRLFWIEDGVDNRSNVNWLFKWHNCRHWSRRCASLAVSPVLPAPIIHLFPSFLEFAVMHFLIGWRTVDLGRRTEKIVHSLFMCIWNLNIINNESTRLPNRSSNLATLQWRPKRNLNSSVIIGDLLLSGNEGRLGRPRARPLSFHIGAAARLGRPRARGALFSHRGQHLPAEVNEPIPGRSGPYHWPVNTLSEVSFEFFFVGKRADSSLDNGAHSRPVYPLCGECDVAIRSLVAALSQCSRVARFIVADHPLWAWLTHVPLQ